MLSKISGHSGTYVTTAERIVGKQAPTQDAKDAALTALKASFENKFKDLTKDETVAQTKIDALAQALRVAVHSFQRTLNRGGGERLIGCPDEVTEEYARAALGALLCKTGEGAAEDIANLQILCHHTRRNADDSKTNWFGSTNFTRRAELLLQSIVEFAKEAKMRSAACEKITAPDATLIERQIADAAFFVAAAQKDGLHAIGSHSHQRLDKELLRSQEIFLQAAEQCGKYTPPPPAACRSSLS